MFFDEVTLFHGGHLLFHVSTSAQATGQFSSNIVYTLHAELLLTGWSVFDRIKLGSSGGFQGEREGRGSLSRIEAYEAAGRGKERLEGSCGWSKITYA